MGFTVCDRPASLEVKWCLPGHVPLLADTSLSASKCERGSAYMMASQQLSRGLVRCPGFIGGLLRAGVKRLTLIASSIIALQLQKKHRVLWSLQREYIRV